MCDFTTGIPSLEAAGPLVVRPIEAVLWAVLQVVFRSIGLVDTTQAQTVDVALDFLQCRSDSIAQRDQANAAHGISAAFLKASDELSSACVGCLDLQKRGFHLFQLEHESVDNRTGVGAEVLFQEWLDDAVEFLEEHVAHTSFCAVDHVYVDRIRKENHSRKQYYLRTMRLGMMILLYLVGLKGLMWPTSL
jgi:hypothetical protein